MPKTKYFFDPQTLSYKKLQRGFSYYLIRGLGFISVSFIFAFAIFFFVTGIIDSPKEKLLKKENSELREQLSQVESQILDMDQQLKKLQNKDEGIYRIIFEADPKDASLSKKSVRLEQEYDRLRKLKGGDFLAEIRISLDNLQDRMAAQESSYEQLFKLAENKKKLLGAIPSIQPVANKDLNRLASGYGYRIDPFYRTRKFHAGLDFSAPRGAEVYATADGKVVDIVSEIWGYGRHIIIDHGFGYQTLYAHLSKFDVKKGQKVTRGQLIGRVGSTGKSTAPHLHYEVHIKGEPVNPAYFFHNDLTDDEFRKLIEIASNPNQSFD